MLKLNKKNTARQLKVSEQIKRYLADIIKNHSFGYEKESLFTITISEVNISIDLKNAYVFIVPFLQNGMELNDQDALELVYKDLYLIKKKLSANLALRYTPKLIFKIDKLDRESQKIDSLFKDPKVAQDLVEGN
ncbi:MAG: ribosome-binding factor A [Rickettsiales bacterium]|nr:ribosome-binding factor A [Rickettsiales bacterium]|tara:strand:+ start:88 stop:489 length:402 start_codon:yes stop_codon:yes gene_type:complete